MVKFSHSVVCGDKLPPRKKKYCSDSCKRKSNRKRNRGSRKGVTRKYFIIQELGGCCIKCGYNKNLAALTFHHMPGNKKLFKLNVRNMSRKSYAEITKEVKKCQLLCANCHTELHNPTLEMHLFNK